MRFLLSLLLMICSFSCAIAADTSFVTHQVQVKGLVQHPFTCTIENVREFKPVTQTGLNIVCSSGETKKVLHTFTGVYLKALLDSAAIVMPTPKERGRYYIKITASDNYTVLYSWNDIYNNPTGEHVLLIYEENGAAIQEDGVFVMICTNDKVTGPRHVKWVSSIEVGKL